MLGLAGVTAAGPQASKQASKAYAVVLSAQATRAICHRVLSAAERYLPPSVAAARANSPNCRSEAKTVTGDPEQVPETPPAAVKLTIAERAVIIHADAWEYLMLHKRLPGFNPAAQAPSALIGDDLGTLLAVSENDDVLISGNRVIHTGIDSYPHAVQPIRTLMQKSLTSIQPPNHGPPTNMGN